MALSRSKAKAKILPPLMVCALATTLLCLTASVASGSSVSSSSPLSLASIPLCGGAPQNMVPFNLDAYTNNSVPSTATQRKLLLLEEGRLDGKEEDDEEEYEYEYEYYDEDYDYDGGSYVADDDVHDGTGSGPFEGTLNRTARTARRTHGPRGGSSRPSPRPRPSRSRSRVGRVGRGLLRMPYQMKRVGCGRKRRARVYFENADTDPRVVKDVATHEAKLVKCLEDISQCDATSYEAAYLLKEARSKVSSLFRPGSFRGMGNKKHQTCAIVGNAGHMVKHKYGSYIDKHDLVLRFNTQQVRRFRDKVGGKVTHRILNNFHTTQACCQGKLPEGRRRGGKGGIDLVLWFPAARNEMRRVCKKKYPEHKLHFLSRRFIGKEVMVMRALRKEMKRLGFGPFGGWKQLTSGAHGLLMLLTMCDSVSVYGMTTYTQSTIDQYGGRQRKTKNGNSWHDWKGESHVWRLLHAMKEVAICSM